MKNNCVHDTYLALKFLSSNTDLITAQLKRKKEKQNENPQKRRKVSCPRLFASRKFNRFSLNRLKYQIGTGMQAKSRVSHKKND